MVDCFSRLSNVYWSLCHKFIMRDFRILSNQYQPFVVITHEITPGEIGNSYSVPVCNPQPSPFVSVFQELNKLIFSIILLIELFIQDYNN